MTDPVPFASLLPRYRALVFDAYGVLVAGGVPYPGVPALLRGLSLPWVILTNDASRAPEVIAARYEGAVAPDRIVSSGLMAQEHLAEHHAGARVGVLGPPPARVLVERAGCEAAPFAEADPESLEVVALMDEAGYDWQRELTRLANLIRRRPEVPVLVPNPDLLFPTAEGDVGIAAGSLAALIEAATGVRARRFGKPQPDAFERAVARLRDDLPDLAPSEVLMVGDTLTTDVVGGQAAGLDTALVLSGNTGADEVARAIERAGVRPTWVVPGVVG